MIRFTDAKPKRATKAPAQPIPAKSAGENPRERTPKMAKSVTKAAKPATKVKAATASRASNMPLQNPSPALAKIVGAAPLRRSEMMGKLWEYIRANGLQNTTGDKRIINCDPLMQDVYGKPTMTMFELAKVGDHLSGRVA